MITTAETLKGPFWLNLFPIEELPKEELKELYAECNAKEYDISWNVMDIRFDT